MIIMEWRHPELTITNTLSYTPSHDTLWQVHCLEPATPVHLTLRTVGDENVLGLLDLSVNQTINCLPTDVT